MPPVSRLLLAEDVNDENSRRIQLLVPVLVVVNADVLTRCDDVNANAKTPLPFRRIDAAILKWLFHIFLLCLLFLVGNDIDIDFNIML